MRITERGDQGGAGSFERGRSFTATEKFTTWSLLFKYFISGGPPKFPMIWTLFKPSIAIAPFSSL